MLNLWKVHHIRLISFPKPLRSELKNPDGRTNENKTFPVRFEHYLLICKQVFEKCRSIFAKRREREKLSKNQQTHFILVYLSFTFRYLFCLILDKNKQQQLYK